MRRCAQHIASCDVTQRNIVVRKKCCTVCPAFSKTVFLSVYRSGIRINFAPWASHFNFNGHYRMPRGQIIQLQFEVFVYICLACMHAKLDTTLKVMEPNSVNNSHPFTDAAARNFTRKVTPCVPRFSKTVSLSVYRYGIHISYAPWASHNDH